MAIGLESSSLVIRGSGCFSKKRKKTEQWDKGREVVREGEG